MACCWGPGKPAATFVMLDYDGLVLDVLNVGVIESKFSAESKMQLKEFLMRHKPHVVVVGVANWSCKLLQMDINETIVEMLHDNAGDISLEKFLEILYAVCGDESLPLLYESSNISVSQLPARDGIIRRAVALGRYLLNPLGMVATLCGPRKEILSWKLTPLEKFLSPDDKYHMIELVMVDATNQFISGLGPRKAASLQRSLVTSGRIVNRKDLMTFPGISEEKVFQNAVGFLRAQNSCGGGFNNLFDGTRIHPESYCLAKEYAMVNYLEYGNGDANGNNVEVLERVLSHVKMERHLLKAVDTHRNVRPEILLNKKETLNDIRLELIQGFQDRRRPYVRPSQDDEFYMISGESEEALCKGMVQVTVSRVQPEDAICDLKSGLTGILSKQDYTDDWMDINELTDKLHKGDILTCRIKSIDANCGQVYLTCRESDMRSIHFENNQDMDPAKPHFKSRMIVHPRFQNISANEAIKFLRSKDPGESVIRPNCRGPSFLTWTLKVHEEVYANTNIVEGGKEHTDAKGLPQIGKPLKIGEDTFEDLDEVMDLYVDPLVHHLKEMIRYRKFSHAATSEVRKERAEDQHHPMRLAYRIGLSLGRPGNFILAYTRLSIPQLEDIISNLGRAGTLLNPHYEYIGLCPKGYKFQEKVFKNIRHLESYFHRYMHESAPSMQLVAAKTNYGCGWEEEEF
ncbi:hypothetical protein BUALT_Bualt17G0027100 [Buddleja alternifolia]|uniref:S1 motif domain-containing protein n=1 Tax=Buddleja alternifolia TaxID=168488 RepID=A0AAV6W5R3_9LAMI|nr:hypothetical protein BUALT_Bualt17G0027100 [Buddleja alternifolia]